MPEVTKDPTIKLFGMTIQFPDAPPPPPPTEMEVDPGGAASEANSSAKDSSCSEAEPGEDEQLQKNENGERMDESKEDEGTVLMEGEEIMDQTVDEIRDGLNAPSVDEDGGSTEISTTDEEEGKMSDGKDKTLKKPDKILPCPRCDSMETKFCYFNNYNTNQPRHFCKKCQRYWTSGGMTRNLPVGAGRRKTKNSAAHYHHHHLNAVRVDHPERIQHHALKANGKVLTLASDSPLGDSVASELNIAEKTAGNGSLNGFYKPVELGIQVSFGAGDNGADHSSGSSSVTAASTKDDVCKNGLPDMLKQQNYHGFAPQLPCFQAPPWPYPSSAVQWSSAVPPPGCFPMPFYPPAMYLGYTTIPCSWNAPWVSTPVAPQHHTSSGPNSPTLGKHSRDDNNKEGEPPKDSNPERCLWVPKTLRFDDPEDAAKSSIWATLGIQHDRVDSIRGGAFKAFKMKDDENSHASKNCRVLLEANPAALSRSLNFHESS